MRIVLVPTADFDRVDQIRATETANEPLNPLEAVDHRRAARSSDCEGDGLGAGYLANVSELSGDFVQSLVPGNLLPARIDSVSGRGTAKRLGQAARAVYHLGRGATFGTERPAGRMSRQVLDADQPAVLDDRGCATSRPTERAITGNALCHGKPDRC